MPNFEKFRLGAPVKAKFEFRGETEPLELDVDF